jgi:hypothetical protein
LPVIYGAGSYGLKPERRTVLPLSGGTPYPCLKTI